MIWWECIKSFLSTHGEWHTAVIGFCDGFFPFKPRYEPSSKPSKDEKSLKETIESEYHYYVSFRVVGFIAWVFFAYGIYRLVT
jgi:hypothetical protein